MLPPWLTIAKREFLERVRTKWFIIGTLLGPVMLLALILVPALLARAGDDENKIAIVDRSGGNPIAATLVGQLHAALTAQGWKPTIAEPSTTDAQLRSEIEAEKLNGFLTVPADPLGAGQWEYRGDNAASQALVARLYANITAVSLHARGKSMGLSDSQLVTLASPPKIKTVLDNGKTEAGSGIAAFIVGYALALILYMAIMLYGVNVMRSVVEEKASRVVELMVAACKPRDLLAGKIVGVGAVGIVQLTAWLTMALLTLSYRETILGWFGVAGGAIALPDMSLPQMTVAILYFILGYYFYAAMFAAVGAMVSSDQEAQQAQMPVTLLLMVPITCVQLVANNPRGVASQVLSMLPISSSTLMPMRFALGGASWLQVLASLAILAASLFVVLLVAAKIYRVGILMYGKRPTLPELWRWVRTKA